MACIFFLANKHLLLFHIYMSFPLDFYFRSFRLRAVDMIDFCTNFYSYIIERSYRQVIVFFFEYSLRFRTLVLKETPAAFKE